MGTVFTAFTSGTDEAAANTTTEAAAGFQTPRTGSWTYESTDTVQGVSVEVTNAAPNTAVWTRPLTPDATTYYFDECMYVAALPAAEFMWMQLRLGSANKAQVQLNPDGSITIKDNNLARDVTAAGFTVAGQWVRCQWGISGSAMEARLWTSATEADLLNLTTSDILTGTYTGGAFNQFRTGVLDAVAVTLRLNRLIGDDTTWPTSGGASNQSPTANAGPDDDTYEGGDTVTLTGAGSTDPDGTVAEYLWRQISGPTVALSSTTVVSPTFTAPDVAGTAVFGLRVKDDDGAQSTEDTVTIEWSAAPAATPTSDRFELFNFATSGTVNESNTDCDNVTSTVWAYVTPGIGEGQGCAQATANGAVKVLTFDLTASGEGYLDAIFQLSALGADPWYIMRALSGSTLRATVRVNTDGTIQTRNASSTSGQVASTGHVTPGEKFRVAWHLDNAGSVQTARLFTGANLYGTSPSSTATGTYNQGTFDHMGCGICQPAVPTGAGTIQVDTMQMNATTDDWPDPFGGTAALLSGRYKLNADGSVTPLEIVAL